MLGMYDPVRPTSGSRPTAAALSTQENPLQIINLISVQMSELVLTSEQRRALKARAHTLRPVVLLGAAGLTESVVREIDRALAAHQLVKIKVPGDDRDARAQIAADLAGNLAAANVLSIGKMIVLFRPLPESEEKQPTEGSRSRPTDRRRRDRKSDA